LRADHPRQGDAAAGNTYPAHLVLRQSAKPLKGRHWVAVLGECAHRLRQRPREDDVKTAKLLAPILALGLACAPPEGDPPGDAGQAGETITLTITEVFADVPHAGVNVTLYDDGEEVETKTAGDDGVVAFTGLSEDGGPWAATVHGDGITTTTQFGIQPGVAMEVPSSERIAGHELVTLSGTVTGVQDAAHNIGVFPYPGQGVNGSSADFSVDVAKDRAFWLLLLENEERSDLATARGYAQDVFQWTSLEHAAISADTSEDFAFDSTQPSTATGSFTIPDSTLPFWTSCSGRLFGAIEIDSWVSRVAGLATRMVLASDGVTFDYEAAYVDDSAGNAFSTSLQCVNNQGLSMMNVQGVSFEGAHDGSGMLAPLDPSGMASNPSLYGELAWDAQGQLEATPQVIVFNERGDVVWFIIGTPGMESFTLPGFPPGTSRTEVFGDFATTAEASFRLCDRSEDRRWFCQHLSAVSLTLAI
jgi:hypothetical protein